jgi:hypothetical protein
VWGCALTSQEARCGTGITRFLNINQDIKEPLKTTGAKITTSQEAMPNRKARTGVTESTWSCQLPGVRMLGAHSAEASPTPGAGLAPNYPRESVPGENRKFEKTIKCAVRQHDLGFGLSRM